MRDEIVEHLDREPFVPFRIILTSGQAYDITNPHLVALGESVMHVMQPRSNRYAILRLNQVASLEVLETAN
jgi:hypothetical protein